MKVSKTKYGEETIISSGREILSDILKKII